MLQMIYSSMKDLEREILELQQLADSTGKENTLMFSKGKKIA